MRNRSAFPKEWMNKMDNFFFEAKQLDKEVQNIREEKKTAAFESSDPTAREAVEGIAEEPDRSAVAKRCGDIEEAVAVPRHGIGHREVLVDRHDASVTDVEGQPVVRRLDEGHERGAVCFHYRPVAQRRFFCVGKGML